MDERSEGEARLGTPEWVEGLKAYLLAESLASLTGLKALIPLLVISVGPKFSDEFPYELRKEFEWLKGWPAIAVLTSLCGLEIVVDAVPVLDELLDKIMILVKPVIATFIVFAHAPQGGSAVVISMGAWGCLDAALVALAKQALTTLMNVASGGSASPVRSLTEGAAVALLSALCMRFPVIAPPLVVFLSINLVCLFCGLRTVRRLYAVDQQTLKGFETTMPSEADGTTAMATTLHGPGGVDASATVAPAAGGDLTQTLPRRSPRSPRSPRVSRSPRSSRAKLTPRLVG